jgi:hypothetical protein
MAIIATARNASREHSSRRHRVVGLPPRQICRSRAPSFCADESSGEGCAVRATCGVKGAAAIGVLELAWRSDRGRQIVESVRPPFVVTPLVLRFC